MSMDALLWIATLLFAATMLILAARRTPEVGADEGDSSSSIGEDSFDAHSSRGRGFDLGSGWTLGGDCAESDRA